MLSERAPVMSVDFVKRETYRAHIRVAFGVDIELLTNERDESSLVRGRVWQHDNLQLAQYIAKFLIAGQLRVCRGGRGGVGGKCDGRNCSNWGASGDFDSTV